MDIRNYGPKKITLTEIKRGTRKIVEQEHNVMPLSESSLNRMMEHGKTGMIIISSNRSEIRSDNPKLDLYDQFEKSLEKKEENDKGKVLRQERYSGAMSRSFYVGDQLTEEDIKARYEDGVLHLTGPKQEAKKVPEKKTILIEG